MVEISIIMAAHNEGDLLWKTVESCRETCAGLDYEIVVADDASEDDCIEQLRHHFPDIPVHRFPHRTGPSPTKDLGAQHARGEVLIFLDAHCKPEPGAIARLSESIRACRGEAMVNPTIACLDTTTWTNNSDCPGHGYLVELDGITWRWIPLEQMRPHGSLYESPSLIGCCVVISKWLYEKLWGFDRNMYMWGVEDVDFGVKSWLLGHPVLHDPVPVIGHRFQQAFTTYTAPSEHFVANQLRMAYKILASPLWREWLDNFRARYDADVFHRAWDIFTVHRGTAEVERVYLAQHQTCDVLAYARRFGLTWPLPPVGKARTEGLATLDVVASAD